MRRYLIYFLLVVATAAVYARVVTFDFVNYDDRVYVTKNPHVRSGLTSEGVLWATTATRAANWHPVSWLSLMLDAEITGLRPGMFHLTNLLLHVANALVLFLVLDRMTGMPGRSGFVAALFALHPLHVESVAWIAERKDVLSTLFWFLTLLAYARYVERRNAGRYLAVVLALVAGLMSKPMLVTVPLVLLLLDYWPLRRFAAEGERHGISQLLWEKTPLFVLAAASCLVTWTVQKQAGAVFEELPVGVRAANAVVAYVAYIGKMLWPTGLAALYPHPRDTLPVWQVAGAALGLLYGTALALRSARRRPYVTVGWLWYLVTLVPVIGLVQVGAQAMADRYTYVPLVGVFIVVAWGAPDLLTRLAPKNFPARLRAWLLPAASLVILAALAGVAYKQVGYWRDSVTLFSRATEVTSGNALAHSALGSALARRGLLDEALPHFDEALRIDPHYAQGHNALGTVLMNMGRIDDAVSHWQEAMRLEPEDTDARANLAGGLIAQGRTEEAIARCREVLRVDPGESSARAHLGLALMRQGKMEEAVSELGEALRSDPEHVPAHGYLASALIEQGNVEEGISHLREALRIEPGHVEDRCALAAALLRQGKVEEAISHYRKALRMAPAHPTAHTALGVLLAQQGRIEEAMSHFREALRADPRNEEAHLNLGVAHFKQGRTEEAIAEFSEVLRIDPGNPYARRYLELAGVE